MRDRTNRLQLIDGHGHHAANLAIVVDAVWDEIVGTWFASSEEIPRLAVTAKSERELLQALRDTIPTMLREDGIEVDGPVPFKLVTES